MSNTTYTFRLPKRFFQDHKRRHCPTPVVLAETKNHYVVSIQDPGCIDLLDDALHYAGSPDYEIGLRSSARATVRALRCSQSTSGVDFHKTALSPLATSYSTSRDGQVIETRHWKHSGVEVDAGGRSLEDA